MLSSSLSPGLSGRPSTATVAERTGAQPQRPSGSILVGTLLSAALAGCAMQVATIGWFPAHGLSGLSLAIVLGMVLGNTVYPRFTASAGSGVAFSKQRLLRIAVVLYGFRLTLADVGHAGLSAVIIDALMLVSTFSLACLLGTRLLGLDRNTSMLVGTGSAICGAAAILAAEPIVNGKTEQVAVAIASVVLFGTLAIFLYPLLYAFSGHWALLPPGRSAFGIYAGSTVHEVAQVFTVGRSISDETANLAVITKMVRVMMLAPFLIALSAWHARRAVSSGCSDDPARAPRRLLVPWFALTFVSVVALNSLLRTPAPLVTAINSLDTFLLAMAMAALGLTTQLSALRKAGGGPILLGLLLWGWLILGGALINSLVFAAFT